MPAREVIFVRQDVTIKGRASDKVYCSQQIQHWSFLRGDVAVRVDWYRQGHAAPLGHRIGLWAVACEPRAYWMWQSCIDAAVLHQCGLSAMKVSEIGATLTFKQAKEETMTSLKGLG